MGLMSASLRGSEWPSTNTTFPRWLCLDVSTPSNFWLLLADRFMQAVGHQHEALHAGAPVEKPGELSQTNKVSIGALAPVDLNHQVETKVIPPQTVVQGLVCAYKPRK